MKNTVREIQIKVCWIILGCIIWYAQFKIAISVLTILELMLIGEFWMPNGGDYVDCPRCD